MEIEKMKYPQIEFDIRQSLELEQFREMDYYAVEHYNLPVELMMENAGLCLARVVSKVVPPDSIINIGVGNGNNGGGGLVAGRRLASWGYRVHLDFFTPVTKPLPAMQLERALKFGVIEQASVNCDVWVDAWLGFSQKQPLTPDLLAKLEKVNQTKAKRISLDIPTGFFGDSSDTCFNADTVLTLAASKKILMSLPQKTQILVADLGIPSQVYDRFGIGYLPFHENSIIQLKR